MAHQGSGVAMPGRAHVGRGYWRSGLVSGPSPPLPGPTLWWDATLLAGADGSTVASWAPAIGSAAYALAQATAGTRPTLYTTTGAKLIHSKPAVWFSGSQWLRPSGSPAAIAQPLSWFLIAGVPSVAGTQCLCDSTAGAPRLQQYFTSGQWNVTVGNGGSTNIVADTAGVHLTVILANGASSQFYVDGTTYSSLGSPAAGNPTPCTLGADFTGGSGWNGYVCELGLYAGVLSAGQLATMRAYAQAKWGTP